jgi:hypothetical protein
MMPKLYAPDGRAIPIRRVGFVPPEPRPEPVKDEPRHTADAVGYFTVTPEDPC